MSSAAAGPGAGRRGASLSLRLALRLALLAAVFTAVAAWAALALVRSSFERELSSELDRMTRATDLAFEWEASRLTRSLEEVETFLVRREPVLLEGLIRRDVAAGEHASSILSMRDLEVLEVLDPSGLVLASAHAPEGRLGLIDPGRLARAADRPELRWIDAPGASGPGFAATRTIDVAGARLVVYGAEILGAAFLERVAGGQAAVLVIGGETPLASTRAASFDLAGLRQALATPPAGRPAIVTDGEGRAWEARSVALTLAGETASEASLVVAVDRSGVRQRLAALGRGFIALGGAAVALTALAGVLLARSVTRPVRELVRAFDAVAAGEADYTFPDDPGRDELGDLIASVSRLQRSLEVQQRRSSAAERVATWRDVARHVAHEVKNPLVPIRLTVENLVRARERAPERFDAMFRDGTRTILEEVEQLRRMVEEFSAFARLPAPEPRPEDLERRVDAVVELFAGDPRVRLVRHRSEDLPALPLDADQIGRALKNLIVNAIEAGADEARDRPVTVEIRTGRDRDMAWVEIRDDGPGFSEDSRRRVFEPYFTTKEGGTGLGMALTYRIVTEHGGLITAENAPGGGALVVVRLPLPGRTHR